MTIESLETDAEVDLSTSRLLQLAIGQLSMSRSCSARLKTLNTTIVFDSLMAVHYYTLLA